MAPVHHVLHPLSSPLQHRIRSTRAADGMPKACETMRNEENDRVKTGNKQIYTFFLTTSSGIRPRIVYVDFSDHHVESVKWEVWSGEWEVWSAESGLWNVKCEF